MIKVYFYAKKTPRKRDGKYPVMGRIVLDGKRAQFYTGINLEEEELPYINDSRHRSIFKEINILADTRKYVRRTVGYMLIYEDRSPSLEEVISIAKEYQTSIRRLFLQSFNAVINDMRKTGAARKTIEKYRLLYDRVYSFIQNKYSCNDLSIYDVDDNFISDFWCYLLENFCYSDSSVEKMMQLLRTVQRRLSLISEA